MVLAFCLVIIWPICTCYFAHSNNFYLINYYIKYLFDCLIDNIDIVPIFYVWFWLFVRLLLLLLLLLLLNDGYLWNACELLLLFNGFNGYYRYSCDYLNILYILLIYYYLW